MKQDREPAPSEPVAPGARAPTAAPQPIDLLHVEPAALIGLEDLGALLATVRGLDAWSDRHAEVLDYAYRGRVARLLTTRADPEALRDFHDHLRKVIALVRDNPGLDPAWPGRWRGYAAVLDARLGALATQDPDGVRKRAHVDRVLDALERGDAQGLPQADLGEKLGLEKANLTRIMNLMEANELIVRRSHGREKRVLLGPNAPRKVVVPASSQRRGIGFLSAKIR